MDQTSHMTAVHAQPDQHIYDVCIIGGGAAGIMAALSVAKHHPEYTVLLLESKSELGKKLLISGAGRCNLTNTHLQQHPASYFHGDTPLVTSIFSQFGYNDIYSFFEMHGIPLMEETKSGSGKIFPKIEHAKTVRDILVDELIRNRVEIRYESPVTNMIREHNEWVITTSKETYKSQYIVLTTGGKTYPALGSDGSGYTLAKQCGHTIIEPIPSAVPLVGKNQLSHLLQGEKVVLEVTSYDGDKKNQSVTGDVLFTQYGLSGSAILDISRDISTRINHEKKTEVYLHINFFPGQTEKEAREILEKRWADQSDMPVSHSLWGLFTEKISAAITQIAQISIEKKVNELTHEEKEKIFHTVTSYEIDITGTRGWNEAEFTAGGIDGNELYAHSLQSKKIDHLFFAGEIIDVDGPIGGYNLSWAWASGWIAGSLQN